MLQWRVFPVLVFAAMYMFSFIGGSFGRHPYGNCIKYAVGEIKPRLTNGDRFCITEGRYVYCKEFKCPITECMRPVVPNNGVCPYCKGTCSYGGAIYQINENFPCLDGVNGCSCRANNIIISTKINTSPENMCLKRP
ncbi:kielin/chordin-like protein [Mytilus californianus]|uniref:kielin/chordin-like protein n=1 Tax=Mytilus californianus TaxID=6549 RepID=UPI0022465693|nr:kielin/chordin-like protein [Mytilus californianus]